MGALDAVSRDEWLNGPKPNWKKEEGKETRKAAKTRIRHEVEIALSRKYTDGEHVFSGGDLAWARLCEQEYEKAVSEWLEQEKRRKRYEANRRRRRERIERSGGTPPPNIPGTGDSPPEADVCEGGVPTPLSAWPGGDPVCEETGESEGTANDLHGGHEVERHPEHGSGGDEELQQPDGSL